MSMKVFPTIILFAVVVISAAGGDAVAQSAELVQVREDFSADPGWEGSNNRIEATNPPRIKQDFGWSATKHAGGSGGEIGGKIWRSRTIAYYAMLLQPCAAGMASLVVDGVSTG
jgi:hypothetical protein